MIRKILHTSDWHIGRRLKEHDRSEEFIKFFSWLENIITSENIDLLLVAGDIFDNSTPSAQAQSIYYSFLGRAAKSQCRHIVIISGNHDSPAFLDAPSEILKLCRIHIVGQACKNIQDEVITLCDPENRPEMIVCAVPYLHDRDVRTMSSEDDFSEIDSTLKAEIRKHYAEVFEHAKILRGDSNIPVVAMGHLFVKGGKTAKNEGVRSLYVGTAIEIESNIFPEDVIYTALGHLHSPQSIGSENVRYSGSPVAMTFGEAGQNKSIYIIEIDDDNNINVKNISVPVFQRLERAAGNIYELEEKINSLGRESAGESIWLEVTHKGDEVIGDLQERLNQCVKEFPNIEILSLYDESRSDTANIDDMPEGLENIEPLEMLDMCFKANNTPEEQQKIFIPMYQEILREMEKDY